MLSFKMEFFGVKILRFLAPLIALQQDMANLRDSCFKELQNLREQKDLVSQVSLLTHSSVNVYHFFHAD